MKIIVAESAGFCWGVRRAMEQTLKLADNEKNREIHTLGPLIHNNQVVEFLSSRGVREAASTDEIQRGIAIIRAHGTTPETLATLKKQGIKVKNATCPRVGKVQALIKGHLSKGYQIIIIGDTGHAEVSSLMGYANGSAFLIKNPEQAKQIINLKKAIVVSQTTFDRKIFDEIVSVLRENIANLKVFCTICDSTAKRQEEVKKLAEKVDCMIIVGGHHSANTTRLAEISRRHCRNVYHIETADELDKISLHSFHTIGVSAGASTPNWIINSVVQALHFKNRETSFAFRVFGWLFYCGLFRAFAAFFLCTGIQNTFLLPADWKFPLISFLYLFSVTNLNGIVSGNALIFSDPPRFQFIRSRRRLLETVSAISIMMLLGIGFTLSLSAFYLLLLSVLLGILYRIRIGIGGKPFRIFDIPGSKNILHGMAWSIVIAVIPIVESGMTPFLMPLLLGAGIVFLIVFSGTVMFDFKDYQGDQFAGKETLPILLGRQRAARMVFFVILSLSLLLTLFAFFTAGIFASLVIIITSQTTLSVFAYYSKRKTIPSDGRFELIVDGLAFIPWLVTLFPALLSISR